MTGCIAGVGASEEMRLFIVCVAVNILIFHRNLQIEQSRTQSVCFPSPFKILPALETLTETRTAEGEPFLAQNTIFQLHLITK